MGCDIHMHVEVKIDGHWEHLGAPLIRGSYWLFSRLANVRNDKAKPITPIAFPRGLPSDCNSVTRADSTRLGDDGHSHTWLSFDEMMIAYREYENELQSHIYNNVTIPFGLYLCGCYIVEYGDESLDFPGIEDIRFVFWFDG